MAELTQRSAFDDIRETLRELDEKLSFAEREYRIVMSRCVTAGMFESTEGEDIYGWEAVLDLCNCDSSRFTRSHLEDFLKILCRDVLKMERHDLHFWDDVGVEESERQTDPRKKGTSAVQFIMYSTIVIHCLDELGTVFLNIFSCRDFDEQAVERLACDFFSANIYTTTRMIPRKTNLHA